VEQRIEHVAILGGTHGNELTGAWLLERWRRHGDPVHRPSFHTHLLLGNPKALQQGRRYVDQDLNRSFDLGTPRSERLGERPETIKLGRNYEQERAGVLRGQLETFRVIPDGALIDLHNTTANMGVSLIFVNQSPFNLKLAAWVQKRLPEVRVYCWLDESLPRRSASSIVERGITVEVGPVANGIVRGDLFWKTERAVTCVLDFIQAYNTGEIVFDGKDELELFVHVESVDFPRDDRDRIRAFVHEELQDRDFQPLEVGAPLFQGLDGETVRYQGEPGLCPVFINEAAYYEKRIAFSLTRRERRVV
jgi:aspartoacylase